MNINHFFPQIAETLCKGTAPIAPFLAEEVFRCGGKFFLPSADKRRGGPKSVFQDGWLRPLPSFDAEFADISQLRHLKARVNQALELKREDGTLGSASEALVLVRLPSGSESLSPIARQGLLFSLCPHTLINDVLLSLLPDPELLGNFFRVSKFSVEEKKPAEGGQEEIFVSKTGLGKCPRCWNWAVTEGTEGGVCPRCAAALSTR